MFLPFPVSIYTSVGNQNSFSKPIRQTRIRSITHTHTHTRCGQASPPQLKIDALVHMQSKRLADGTEEQDTVKTEGLQPDERHAA